MLTLSEFRSTDKDALLLHLNNKNIYDKTLRIPFPYGEADAAWWLDHVAEETRKLGRAVNWAVRDERGYLIGAIGYHDVEPGVSFKAEIGYWLAEDWWGRGIMSQMVQQVTDLGFGELGLVRITAVVFAGNTASMRVLEKCGFVCEGTLRNYYRKDGVVFDAMLYAKVTEN